MSEAQPETVAGRRLLSILGGTADADYQSPITNAILAIEAEARAAGAARCEAALREWVAAETPGIVLAKPFAEYGYDVAKAEIASVVRDLPLHGLPRRAGENRAAG